MGETRAGTGDWCIARRSRLSATRCWTPSSTATSARPSETSSLDTKHNASGSRDGGDERVSSQEGSDQSRSFFIGGRQFALSNGVRICSDGGRTGGGGGRRPSLIGRGWWLAEAKEEGEHLSLCASRASPRVRTPGREVDGILTAGNGGAGKDSERGIKADDGGDGRGSERIGGGGSQECGVVAERDG
ncbi:hypothetical protein SCHPADRAFT_888824 [Schizopora paradoxa]|uniref:Uncharacterized protein n=1 Tax=Schizopora paradoxa TaxID=27342 RepID=A0A0H2RTB8_9AGAM|nr:hypothetical protein SCHPADRAFT_888824 [Schizopora paradoxa]